MDDDDSDQIVEKKKKKKKSKKNKTLKAEKLWIIWQIRLFSFNQFDFDR